jgi:polysaccharide export outer membrane protein
MLRCDSILRRVRRLSFVAVFAGLTCGLLQAQSTSNAQPVFNAPETAPAAPVGTSFNAAENKLDRPETRVTRQVGADYKIGADDVLTINVWHEPEVSRNVPVRPDGNISLPLLGDVHAAGLTPTQLRNELQVRFSLYLKNPSVSVIVAEIRSQRINILGQVGRPGTYPLIPPMTVIDAIAAAGGLKEFAKPKKIYVLRTLANGQRQRIKFDYNDVLKGKRGSKDLLLQTLDTVVVP